MGPKGESLRHNVSSGYSPVDSVFASPLAQDCAWSHNLALRIYKLRNNKLIPPVNVEQTDLCHLPRPQNNCDKQTVINPQLASGTEQEEKCQENCPTALDNVDFIKFTVASP